MPSSPVAFIVRGLASRDLACSTWSSVIGFMDDLITTGTGGVTVIREAPCQLGREGEILETFWVEWALFIKPHCGPCESVLRDVARGEAGND